MRTSVARSLGLTADRFDIEPEITARLLMAGHTIVERPVTFTPRSRAAGKKIGWRDGVAAVRVLLRHRFSRRTGVRPMSPRVRALSGRGGGRIRGGDRHRHRRRRRSRSPARDPIARPDPSALLALVLTAWPFAAGPSAVPRRWRGGGTRSQRRAHAAAALLAAAAIAVGLIWGTFVAGGSDSYCYLNQAELIARGPVRDYEPLADRPGVAGQRLVVRAGRAPASAQPVPVSRADLPGRISPCSWRARAHRRPLRRCSGSRRSWAASPSI